LWSIQWALLYNSLAKVFNFEISGLPDRFLMEMEENVNPGMGKGQFSRYALAKKKQSQVNNPASNVSNQLRSRKRL